MTSSSSAEAERQPILGVPSDSPSQEPIWREKKDRKTTVSRLGGGGEGPARGGVRALIRSRDLRSFALQNNVLI